MPDNKNDNINEDVEVEKELENTVSEDNKNDSEQPQEVKQERLFTQDELNEIIKQRLQRVKTNPNNTDGIIKELQDKISTLETKQKETAETVLKNDFIKKMKSNNVPEPIINNLLNSVNVDKLSSIDPLLYVNTNNSTNNIETETKHNSSLLDELLNLKL